MALPWAEELMKQLVAYELAQAAGEIGTEVLAAGTWP